MNPLDVADNNAVTERASSAYVPPLQRTEGQPPPIAAHGGLSYMSFDRRGDAGTAVAIQDALAEIAEGEGQRVIDMIDKAPPGPIETKWGLGFRDYEECVKLLGHLVFSADRRTFSLRHFADPNKSARSAVALRAS
jgi:hypothetical protein